MVHPSNPRQGAGSCPGVGSLGLRISGDSSVQVLEFYSDSSKIGEATAGSGYTVHWAKPPVRTSTLTAIARDAAGLHTVSAPVQLIVRPVLSAASHVRIASPHQQRLRAPE